MLVKMYLYFYVVGHEVVSHGGCPYSVLFKKVFSFDSLLPLPVCFRELP